MAPPRKSLAHAYLTGAAAKNPQRYRARREPLVTDPIGEPPKWMKPDAAEQWRELVPTLPWLNRSHRATVAIASILMAKQAVGAAGIPALQLLRQVLGSLGANPTFKVSMPPADGDHDDLLD